jgi:hypothetical protein
MYRESTFSKFYKKEAILDSKRENLVAVGGESCSSGRQSESGSSVVIYN